MRQRKVRGHRRRWKDIENWRRANLDFDLTNYLLNQDDRFYVKIGIHPWSGLSICNSITPEPKGKTKLKMLYAILDIYENWKKKLDQLGQPYYLKIWFFEPRFSQSQVVGAIGENVDFYKNTFFKPELSKELNAEKYKNLKPRLDKFTWEYQLDEDHYDNTFVEEPEDYESIKDYEVAKRRFDKLLKKPHRTVKFKEPIWKATESYLFKRGDLWLGTQI